jgi:hypothetical protein
MTTGRMWKILAQFVIAVVAAAGAGPVSQME